MISRNKALLTATVFLILVTLSLQAPIEKPMTAGKTVSEIAGSFTAANEAPKMIKLIPNMSDALNSTFTINLSLYFKEPNGENMSYSFTPMPNISVSLDNSTNMANLTPQRGWEGRNTFYFQAFDASGNKTASNNISITIRDIILIRSKYDVATGVCVDGEIITDEVNLSYATDNELQNITIFTLESYDFGRIRFGGSINISNDTDLNIHTNISNNFVQINSSVLPNFNMSAMLWLYNLSFTDPRILRDGEACPATICTEINYSADTGILIFNVTSFSAYTAEESRIAEESSPLPGGQGEGGKDGARRIPPGEIAAPQIPSEEFETKSYMIKADVRQNRARRESIKVLNPTDSPITVEVSMTKSLGFIYFDKSITIAPKEVKDIEIIVAPTEENLPGTYSTQIILKKGKSLRFVPLIINVQPVLQLLDLELNILSENKEVAPGENLLAGMRISNLEQSEKINASIIWTIKDFNNNILLTESSLAEVETQAAFIKKIFIPNTIEKGEYVLFAVATYGNSSVTSSKVFRVIKGPAVEKPIAPVNGLLFIVIIIAAAVLLIIILVIVVIYEKKRIDLLVKKDDEILHDISKKLK